MLSVFAISEESQAVVKLRSELTQNRLIYFDANGNKTVAEQLAMRTPDLVLVELDGNPGTWELVHQIKQESQVPIIALVSRETLDSVDGNLPVDDFLVSPWDAKELALRVKRLMKKANNREGSELIRCGDLVIDQVKREVIVSGRVIMLTFKEYELLKFLASNPSHVFTRDTLLNSVWGYDYYGGDRTVDVHIRRLRSKIEHHNLKYIETIRNVGYRFRAE